MIQTESFRASNKQLAIQLQLVYTFDASQLQIDLAQKKPRLRGLNRGKCLIV